MAKPETLPYCQGLSLWERWTRAVRVDGEGEDAKGETTMQLFPAIDLRGGKPGICQGSCAAAPEQVEEFLKEQNR